MKVRFGIIGGGLMGREVASAISRWHCLNDFPVEAEVIAVSDVRAEALLPFQRVPSIRLLTTNIGELLNSDEVDVVYVAVPHHLHEEIYAQVLEAGKDLLAEKPFGIDLASAQRIASMANKTGRFVRCSSEFPFYPGAQTLLRCLQHQNFGDLIEVHAGFLHSSDMDLSKPINWKRQRAYCGEIGVMGDLGLHVAHLPLRVGYKPTQVYAQLQDLVPQRRNSEGEMAACDTFDNATLHLWFENRGREVPMRWEMKRLAPGETNTWYVEALGLSNGVKYSTKDSKKIQTFAMGPVQSWSSTDLGHTSVFPVSTGAIFEFGFPDAFLQMLAAFVAERAGVLGDRFGCATPEEAVGSHVVFDAALESFRNERVVTIDWAKATLI